MSEKFSNRAKTPKQTNKIKILSANPHSQSPVPPFQWLLFFTIFLRWINDISFLVFSSHSRTPILRRHHYRWRAAKFDFYSAVMAIEKWGVFSVPNLLWHGNPFMMTVSETLRYSNLRVWSFQAGIRKLNLPHARWTLQWYLFNES